MAVSVGPTNPFRTRWDNGMAVSGVSTVRVIGNPWAGRIGVDAFTHGITMFG